MNKLLIAFIVLLITGCKSGPDSGNEKVYCMSLEGLYMVKNAIEKNDPAIQVSYTKLLKQADKALLAGPFSVMQKNNIPPSGNKHDYFSVPPYSGTGDGLTNPRWYVDYDRVPLEKLTQSLETLALAYFFTGEQKFARRAVVLIREWFLNSETSMNPDLEFAQARTWVGVIDTRFLPRIIDCIGLLENSGYWNKEDQELMVEWCGQFMKNVQNRTDKEHMNRGHNISSWYHVQMASIALFSRDTVMAKTMIERTKARIDSALNTSGGFKEEWPRTRSLSYSCFHSFALFNLASMGERVGIDLWNYKTTDGRGFQQALEYISMHSGFANAKKWPHKEIEGAKDDWWNPFYDMLPSVLYHAAIVYDNEDFDVLARQIPGERFEEFRIHVMCGLPLRWFSTISYQSD